MEVVASLSQGRTAAAQCGLFTYKSVSVIFEPPCSWNKYSTINLLRGTCTKLCFICNEYSLCDLLL